MKNKGLVFIGVGFEAVGVVLASVWLGDILDKTFQTKGLFTIIITFIGLGGWFAHVLFMLKKMNKN